MIHVHNFQSGRGSSESWEGGPKDLLKRQYRGKKGSIDYRSGNSSVGGFWGGRGHKEVLAKPNPAGEENCPP